MSSSDIAIRVSNLCKRYEIYSAPRDRLKQFVMPSIRHILGRAHKQYFIEFWALKDVSFEIRKGETVGIIGRNGSGKSTLLQIICGTLTPTSGSVEIRGRIAALLELGSGFNPEFTGRENVYMNAAVLGLSKHEISARFEDIVAFADIGDFIEQPVKTYSSGMMMRLAFAVAVNVDPEILIVDEALAVGDMAFQQKCYEKMEEIKRRGVTILFVSHDIQMVRGYCDLAIYLVDGQKMSYGEPEYVCEVYLKDLLSESQDIDIKHANESRNKIELGNKNGEILSVDVLGNSGKNIFYKNEIIKILIKVYYHSSVEVPVVFCQIRDVNGYVLYGKRFYLEYFNSVKKADAFESTLQINFCNALLTGKYSLTCSLNDNPSSIKNVVLDKKIACSTFSVQIDNDNCHGVIDLGMIDSNRK